MKLVLDQVAPLAETFVKRTRAVRVKLFVERVDQRKLEALRDALARHPGTCPVTLELASTERWTVSLRGTGMSVEPSDALMSSLERLFGEKVCDLR